MVLSVVEAEPAFCKPLPADVRIRNSTGERCDFGALAPLSTRDFRCIFRELVKVR